MNKYEELRIPAKAVISIDMELDHDYRHPPLGSTTSSVVPVTYTIKAVVGDGMSLGFAERIAADELAKLRKEIERLKRDVQDWKDEATSYSNELEDQKKETVQETKRRLEAEGSAKTYRKQLEHVRAEQEATRALRYRGESWHHTFDEPYRRAEVQEMIRKRLVQTQTTAPNALTKIEPIPHDPERWG